MRRRGKVEYPTVKVDTGLSAILEEEAQEPQLSKAQLGALKKISRLAFKLVNVRAQKALATSKETQLKEEIYELLKGLREQRVIGLVRHAGPETSTEIKRVEVLGREVADPVAMLDYLGPYASEVVKSIQLPFELMLQDEAKFNQALSFLSGLYGPEMISALKVELHVGRLDKLKKDGLLTAEPRGVWRYTRQGSRLEAKILS